jgi:hypothetical protein
VIDAAVAVRILLRITMAFTVFYVVTSRVSFPDAVIGDKKAYGFIVNYLWAIAAVFGVIACFRPSFGL